MPQEEAQEKQASERRIEDERRLAAKLRELDEAQEQLKQNLDVDRYLKKPAKVIRDE